MTKTTWWFQCCGGQGSSWELWPVCSYTAPLCVLTSTSQLWHSVNHTAVTSIVRALELEGFAFSLSLVFIAKWSASYWMSSVDFGESVEFMFFVRNQVLLLGAHGEQRLWYTNTVQSKTVYWQESVNMTCIMIQGFVIYCDTGRKAMYCIFLNQIFWTIKKVWNEQLADTVTQVWTMMAIWGASIRTKCQFVQYFNLWPSSYKTNNN